MVEYALCCAKNLLFLSPSVINLIYELIKNVYVCVQNLCAYVYCT